jgi:hypothetical protein
MNAHRQLSTIAIAAVALLGFCTTAFAQIAIDHNKALSGGVSPGDGAGYPITINQPGHYVLKSNLLVPAGLNGVEITASNVTLDLNGYSVIGPGSCSYQSFVVTCTGGAANAGIVAGGSTSNTTLRNGAVMGFFLGVHVKNGRVSGLTSSQHSGDGFSFGTNSDRAAVTASDLVAELNAGHGIVASWGGNFERLVVRRNGGYGFTGSGGTGAEKQVLVSQSLATMNGACGFAYANVRGSVSGGNKTGAFCSAVLVGGNVADGIAN